MQESPLSPDSVMAKMENILHPSKRELLFARVPVLVEGIEDVAIFATFLEVTGRLDTFHALGCHFVVCDGKCNLSRPLAVANCLEISAFVIFDADADNLNTEVVVRNKRDNSCFLRLCDLTDFDPLPDKDFFSKRVVMWGHSMQEVLHNHLGDENWKQATEDAREIVATDYGSTKKSSLHLAAVIEILGREKLAPLEELWARLKSFAVSVQPGRSSDP